MPQVNDSDLSLSPPDDLVSMSEAQCAISAQTEINKVIEAVLLLALQQARAERGLLLLNHESAVEIASEATVQDGAPCITAPSSMASLQQMPGSILRYVLRQAGNVVLPDTQAKHQFSDDRYLRSRRVHSALCLPLIAQRELLGVLYLENCSDPRAFKDHGIIRMELLCGYGAVALKNATLRRGLERDATKRRRKEPEAEKSLSKHGKPPVDPKVNPTGGLVAALAHEINQPLAAIGANAEAAIQLLDVSKPNFKELRGALEDVIRDTSRASQIVQGIRSIFQRDAITMSILDLADIVNEARQVAAASLLARDVTIHSNVPASMRVMGNRAQLIQVILNLISNACEAMENNDGLAREVEISAGMREPGWVYVSVCDSGRGIATEILPRLFEPFFTTKSKGIGMGLAIVRLIIENHGGRVWATCKADRGAKVTFELLADPHLRGQSRSR